MNLTSLLNRRPPAKPRRTLPPRSHLQTTQPSPRRETGDPLPSLPPLPEAPGREGDLTTRRRHNLKVLRTFIGGPLIGIAFLNFMGAYGQHLVTPDPAGLSAAIGLSLLFNLPALILFFWR